MVNYAISAGHSVRAAVRPGRSLPEAPAEWVEVPTLEASPAWQRALEGVDAVVHTAGRAHVMKESAADPLAAFRSVNTAGTLALAEAAASAGVRRFVFVSSIKVSGESTRRAPFRERDPARPADPYAISKWEAERALLQLARRTKLEIVIVRPPLIYGPGVRANFLRLMRWVDRQLPLPFACVDNRRSLISLGNLCQLLHACTTHPAAAGELFLAADDEAPSTRTLVESLGRALGRRAQLWPVPPTALVLAGALLGRSAQVRRLCDSLEVDATKARELLQWQPAQTLQRGLQETARWYREGATSLPSAAP